MQPQFLLSGSELNPISDFQYIYDLAKCSKCQIFTLLKSTNKLYGAVDDCSSVHEIDVPFLVNTDLEFYFDNGYRDLVPMFDGYFIPEKYPWVIIPTFYWEMYKAGDIYAEFDFDKDVYDLYDKSTKQPITQIHMYKHVVNYDRHRILFRSVLDGFFNRIKTLGPANVFTNMHQHPKIREAFDSKAALGRFLCRFTNESVDVLVYFYKGLFTLSKSDTLDIDIRFDLFNNTHFMATYKPKKKKNPVAYNKYGVPYSERIHVMYMNLA